METEIKREVLDILLKTSRSKTITGKQIVLLINTKFNLEGHLKYNTIKLRLLINKLRQEEIPVIGNHNGYYISYDIEDINFSIQSLESRIMGIKLAQDGLKKCIKNIEFTNGL